MQSEPTIKTQHSAMGCALTGLFDYAGIFPPAEQELRAALQDYLAYRRGPHAWALGSLVIDVQRLDALRDQFRERFSDLSLSVVATNRNFEELRKYLYTGLPIETIEIKAGDRNEILQWQKILLANIAAYVEVPLCSSDCSVLNAIGESGMRAKLRMGGIVEEAFPATASVAAILKTLAERGIPFKATAGLHHPLRSRHPFTYHKDSEIGMMHGFMNLMCASALVWFGGEADEAAQLLEEQDLHAWHVTANAIQWRSRSWSINQLQEVRERFLMSIGSCSFFEPMNDLEMLGWL